MFYIDYLSIIYQKMSSVVVSSACFLAGIAVGVAIQQRQRSHHQQKPAQKVKDETATVAIDQTESDDDLAGCLQPGGKPLVTFDLETTGLRVAHDRIIEIAAVKRHPDGRTEVKGPQRVNPRMPVSAEAARVTGITTADLADAPTWEAIAAEWREFFDGCVLHGYNAKRFDVPLLRLEFARAGVYGFPPLGAPVVDSCRVFFRKEDRSLAAALVFYCDGRELTNGHTALADAVAAHRVLGGQLRRYRDLPATPEALAAWCREPGKPTDATWDGKLRWAKDGRLAFGFGPLEGKPLAAAAVEDRDRLLWMSEQPDKFSDEVRLIVKDALAGVIHTKATLPARLAEAAGDGDPAPANGDSRKTD